MVGDSLRLPGVAWVNVAVIGATTGYLAGLAPVQVDTLRKIPGPLHLMVFWEGTNDLSYGASVDSAVDMLRAFVANRRAVGWQVIVASVLPRVPAQITPEDFESRRQTYNTWMRGHWREIADGFVDVASDVGIGTVGANFGPYYMDDEIHLRTTGEVRVATLMRPEIGRLVAAACPANP